MFQDDPRSRPVLVLGEVLCDLFAPEAGVPLDRAPVLVPRIGGAPANVAVQLARLGAPVELLTAVGGDPMGERLLRLLRDEGVGTALARVKADRKTGICMVEVDARGERSFHPWREKSAELALSVKDVDAGAVRGAAVLHHGTVGLRTARSRATLARAVRLARDAGVLVSVDVNLRWRMFASREALLEGARRVVRDADVVKATDEEAIALWGEGGPDELVGRILEQGAALACVTLGERGAVLATAAARVDVPAPRVPVVDATGAGDAFMGALLAEVTARGLDRQGLCALDAGALSEIGRRACRAGARVVTALGATTAMPTRAELDQPIPGEESGAVSRGSSPSS